MPAVARLRPQFTAAQAHDELRASVDRIAGLFPWPAPDWNREAAALPLQEDLVKDLRPKLLVLQSAVLIVLLIACANAGSLLLARAATRGKEMALRATLGARRGRIVRQLLTESLLLCVLGGAAGIALAVAMVSGLEAALPADARGFARIELDPGVVAFATGLSLFCGLLFGVVPAAAASRVDLTAMIKTGGPRSASRSGTRLRAAFVAGEVALAVVLAVGAGLLLRTLHGLSRVDPGFRSARILTAVVSPNPAACDERASCVALYDEILRRVVAQGGAEDAAAASSVPLGPGQPLLPVEMDGHPLQVAEKVPPLLWSGAVTSGYFRVLGVPILRGRGFGPEDAYGAAPVAVVSAATARRYWPGQDPIGKRVRVVMGEQHWRTVVGVAGDVRQYTLSGREPAQITGALYLPYPQAVGLDRRIPRVMTLVVKTPAEASSVAGRLREVVARVNPEMPVSDVRGLEGRLEDSIQEPRLLGGLFAGFAAGALLLAAIGTYGIVSYQAAQRTYEIGVRVAVGATRAQVFGLVVGQGLRLAVVGLALGLTAAVLLGRALESFLYGVSARDPFTLGTVGALLLGTVLLASSLPGRRAAAIDPVRALRVD
jgi:putative ABC transport system permease protein